MENIKRVTAKLQELLNLIPAEDVTKGNIVVYQVPTLPELQKMYVVESGKYYKNTGEPCDIDDRMSVSANEFLSRKLKHALCKVLSILIIDGNVVTIIGTVK